jgi:hypothetical protein
VTFAFSTNQALDTATWTIGFTTEVALQAGDTVAFAAPTGTVFPQGASAYAVETGSGQAVPVNTVVVQDGNLVDLGLGGTGTLVAADTPVVITASQVQNPPPGVYSNEAFWVFHNTSTPINPTQGAVFTTVDLTPTSVVAGATATWTWGFLSPVALTGDKATITVDFPGTLPSQASSYVVQDLTTGQSGQPPAVTPTSAGASLMVPFDVAAGDRLAVVAQGVQNPAAGTEAASAFAVTETGLGAPLLPTAGVALVSTQEGITEAVSSNVNGATGVTWTFGFPAEAELKGGDQIVLTLDTVPYLPSDPGEYTLTVNGVQPIQPAQVSVGACSASTGLGDWDCSVAITLPPGTDIPALSLLSLQIRGVTNPPLYAGVDISLGTTGVPPSPLARSTFSFNPNGSAPVEAPAGNQVSFGQTPPALPPQPILGQDGSPATLVFMPLNANADTACTNAWNQALQTGDFSQVNTDCYKVFVNGAAPVQVGGESVFWTRSPNIQISVQDDTNQGNACPGTCTLSIDVLEIEPSTTNPGQETAVPLPSQFSGDNTLSFALPNTGAQIAFEEEDFVCAGSPTSCNTYHAYLAPITILQTPTAIEQLNVLPYKILYQPPGTESYSFFSLQADQTAETDYSMTQSTENSLTTSQDWGLSAQVGFDLAGFKADVSNDASWDSSATNTQSSATTNSQGIGITSAAGESWQSFTGGSKMEDPSTAPWMYDEYVFLVHPQIAIWDTATCPDGAAASNGGCQGGTASNVGAAYTLIGGNSFVDVSAGELATCAQGAALTIPGDFIPQPVLMPSECQSLLQLDPFAAAGSQAANPSATLGDLAQPVEFFAAGAPGLGTNGTQTIQLSQTNFSSQSTSSTSTFTTVVDTAFMDKVGVEAGYDGDFGTAMVGGSFTFSQSNATTQSVSVTQTQTSSSTIEHAAGFTLGDVANPLATQVWYDARWGTLMFQAPGLQVTSVDPASGVPGMQVTITGYGFWDGAVGVSFCPSSGSGGCVSAQSANPVSNNEIVATVPDLPAGTYTVQVTSQGVDSTPLCPSGTSSCPANAFTVLSQLPSSGPTVTSVAPAQGPTGGGTLVQIQGSDLGSTEAVWFGVSTPSEDPGLLAAWQAAGHSGPGPVEPSAAFVALGNGTLLACAPPVSQPETVWVSVYGPSGWSPVTPGSEFTYSAGSSAGPCDQTSLEGPPTVTGVSPAEGPETGGTVVTVTGTGFTDRPVSAACNAANCPPGSTVTLLLPPQVAFCSLVGDRCAQATDVQVINSGTLVATAPPGVGVADVRVANGAGFSAPTGADQFSYQPAAACAGCPGPGSLALGAESTQAAATGDAPVHVFATVLNTYDQPVAGATVSFATTSGTLSATQATTDSTGVAETTLTSAVPGPATVTAEVYASVYLQNETTVDFLPVPVVTGLSPAAGPTAGGTTVTISGSGFTGADQVYFGGVPATGVHVVSDGELLAVAPPGAGTVEVRVANAAVESGPTTGDQYAYTPSAGTSSSSLPLALGGVQLEDAQHQPLPTGAALAVGQQYYLTCQVQNLGSSPLTPLVVIEALQEGQVLSLQAVQSQVAPGGGATVTVLFTPTVAGTLTFKFLAWSGWLSAGGTPLAPGAQATVNSQ